MIAKGKLRGKDLAKHWKVTPAYVSKLRRKGMPEFETFAQADTWREINCPPDRRGDNGRRRSSPKTTSPDESDRAPPDGGEEGGGTIDVSQFVLTGDFDFEQLMIRQSQEAPQIAFGLLQLAAKAGDPAGLYSASKTWAEAAKQAKTVRADFLELEEKKKNLIRLDRAMDIAGRELQGLRRLLDKQGARLARLANPDNPALAQKVIDADVDKVFALMESLPANIEDELANG